MLNNEQGITDNIVSENILRKMVCPPQAGKNFCPKKLSE